eukprot:TRINITY_DN72929_c0_g1_i1.p1 TRINITY_DN72929_c0_g1~~TRINITY_DN72929_c0_g1_i1.p1  ORF type:complete len:478 (-),score=49.57 TRINITY_DN72929_c0_g1_i1:429-1862(-)
MPAPHYVCLGLSLHASAEEVRSAYRRAALSAHPDKGGSAAQFLKVVRAFEVLSDPIARRRYDSDWIRDGGTSSEEEAADTAESKHSPPVFPAQAPRSKRPRHETIRASGQASGRHQFAKDPAEAAALILDQIFDTVRHAHAEERHVLLSSLGKQVQAALLVRFERQKPATASSSTLTSEGRCENESEDESFSSEDGQILALTDAEPQHTTDNSAQPPGLVCNVRGVSRRAYRGNVPLYAADVALRGFRVRSRLHESLEDAVECHIKLLGARRAVLQDMTLGSTTFEDSIRKHFAIFQHDPACNFFVQLHSQAVIGRKLYSPECRELDSVLDAWQRLNSAMKVGWPSLRATWIDIQSEQGWEGGNRGRGRSMRGRPQLEALVLSWESNDLERRQRARERQERQKARAAILAEEQRQRLTKIKERRRRRVLALGCRYERFLRLSAQEVQRRRKQLNATRLNWHRRPDLTMEEILRGPPM